MPTISSSVTPQSSAVVTCCSHAVTGWPPSPLDRAFVDDA
jgi:hypothetical protein